MEMNYPDNSKKTVDEQQPKKEKIISGKGEIKQSKDRRFSGLFTSDDIKNVVEYVLEDQVVPGIKYMLAEFGKSVLDGWILGNNRNNPNMYGRSTYSNPSYIQTNYGRYSRQPNQAPVPQQGRRSRLQPVDAIVDTYQDAQELIFDMHQTIAKFQMVSLGQMYDDIGVPTNSTDFDYGWYDIGNPRPSQLSDGRWVVKLPRPTYLN